MNVVNQKNASVFIIRKSAPKKQTKDDLKKGGMMLRGMELSLLGGSSQLVSS